ncbi:MAG: PH domain-containing protein [Oscillospiraceae bacterium]
MKNSLIDTVWEDRKRTLFGLPLSFTKYRLTKEKLLVDTGFLNQHQEEVRLYRIMDVSLSRSIWQRIFGVGTIHCCSGDKTTPEFDIKSIKNPDYVKETFSNMIEQEKISRRVSSREFMGDEFDENEDGFDEHNDSL